MSQTSSTILVVSFCELISDTCFHGSASCSYRLLLSTVKHYLWFQNFAVLIMKMTCLRNLILAFFVASVRIACQGICNWDATMSSLMEWYSSGAGCSKLTTSIVNGSLKFQTLMSEICQYFLLKKCEKLLHYFSVFGTKVVNHLTS